jgi:hypothetical protein
MRSFEDLIECQEANNENSYCEVGNEMRLIEDLIKCQVGRYGLSSCQVGRDGLSSCPDGQWKEMRLCERWIRNKF